MADQAGEARRRDQERTLRPPGGICVLLGIAGFSRLLA